ncbi:ABC transporter ATP-binding protein [Spiroplasma endosymbiont of Aspidapion aeneum]|uniref:ABC transporter ATP-binding protein n=1 Tax=Spiroplasma endosymbiont of Aspidapion aeneum TaxID=3066276 RepID=UPI00313DDCD7
MIKINKVSKIFNEHYANKDISFSVAKGQITGILGPNGSGKTTLFRQITGFIKSDEGDIVIDQINPWNNQHKIFSNVGYILGETVFFDNLRPNIYLKNYLSLRNFTDFDFLNYLIDYFELDLNKNIKNLSKGNKQKVAIIAALCVKPKILILDEPTSGLDPFMQKKFVNMLREFSKKYMTTVLISSHTLPEIRELCDNVILLKKGEVVSNVNIKGISENKLNDLFNKTYPELVEIELPKEKDE